MSVPIVTTCKKCGWKTEVKAVPFTDIFGRVHEWQDANTRKCRGCGHDHGIRISVKEATHIRPKRLSA